MAMVARVVAATVAVMVVAAMVRVAATAVMAMAEVARRAAVISRARSRYGVEGAEAYGRLDARQHSSCVERCVERCVPPRATRASQAFAPPTNIHVSIHCEAAYKFLRSAGVL